MKAMSRLKQTANLFLFCFLFLNTPYAVRSAEIGSMYNYCSEYKNTDFEVKSQDALVCAISMTAVLSTKKDQCVGFSAMYKRASDSKTKELLSTMGNIQALGPKTTLFPFILAFLNWAEKNPDEWTNNAYFRSNYWPTENMRCIAENPFGD